MSNDPYSRMPDTRLPQGTLTPSKVSFEDFEGRRVGVIYSLMAIGSMLRPRWLPEKSFPPYAYLPGRQPHPVRDPAGHSYHVEPMPVAAEASLGSDVFLWGLDLFNHGYYWEAHEAWEGLWQVVDRGGPSRMLFKGLILLSASRREDPRGQTCGGCASCGTRRGAASSADDSTGARLRAGARHVARGAR